VVRRVSKQIRKEGEGQDRISLQTTIGMIVILVDCCNHTAHRENVARSWAFWGIGDLIGCSVWDGPLLLRLDENTKLD